MFHMKSVGRGTARSWDQKEWVKKLTHGALAASPKTAVTLPHLTVDATGEVWKTASWDIVGSGKKISKQNPKQQN